MRREHTTVVLAGAGLDDVGAPRGISASMFMCDTCAESALANASSCGFMPTPLTGETRTETNHAMLHAKVFLGAFFLFTSAEK